jgi:6-methylsalicylate decarboxylase
MGYIDVHHHFFPADINKEASNKKVGWRAPAGTLPWTPDTSLNAMDASAIDLAVLSLPAIFAGSVSEENRSTTRERNANLSRIVRAHPDRFGFFASLPFMDDVEGLYSCVGRNVILTAIKVRSRKLRTPSTFSRQTG